MASMEITKEDARVLSAARRVLLHTWKQCKAAGNPVTAAYHRQRLDEASALLDKMIAALYPK